MKKTDRKIRWIAGILSVVMLVMCVLPAAAVEESRGVAHHEIFDARKDIQTLSKYVDVAQLRAALNQALNQCKASADISSFRIPNTDANADAVWYLIYNEMPMAFNVKEFFVEGDDYISEVYFFYRYPLAKYQSMRAEVDAAIDRLLQGIKGNSSLSAVQKALLLHDRLAEVCEYDFKDGENQFNIYGALVEGKAACYGYALAYDYLTEQVGIEGYICVSRALDHAWNIIKVNGNFYHVDVTWDDYAWEEGYRGNVGTVSHTNFLRSSTGIYATGHKARDYDTYPTDTTFDNYFWQHSEAAFQLVGNELYYIDNFTEQIKRYSDRKAIYSVKDTWRNATKYWENCARLASAGGVLYFSTAKKVYKLDLSALKATVVFEPSLTGYQSIYGLTYSKGNLLCDINDAPPYEGSLKNLTQVRKQLDAQVPTASIAATNNVAASQTVTLKMNDDTGLAGYYWGTNSSYLSNTYTASTAATVTKVISEPGTYYLTARDTVGRVSATQSITFYRTTLNANGGTVSYAAVLTAKGNSITLPKPSRTDYKYMGWGTSAGATSGITSLTPTGNATYYAVWMVCDHTIPELRYKAPTAAKDGAWQRCCAGCGKVFASEPIAAGHPFTDVKDSSAWFYPYAMYGKAYGLFKNAAFNGSANITRAEFVTTLCRTGFTDVLKEERILSTFGKAQPGEFVDIAGQWYAPYVRYMKFMRVIGGNDKNQFNGNDPITREEVAAIIHRMTKELGEEKLTFGPAVSAFTDMKDVASWFKEDVEWARKSGLFAGNAQKQMEPKKNNSRTEMAVVLQRFTMSYWGIKAV